MAKSATMGAAFSKTRRCASYCRQLFLFFLKYFTFFTPIIWNCEIKCRTLYQQKR